MGYSIAQDYGGADCAIDARDKVVMCFGVSFMKAGQGLTIGSTILTGYTRESFALLDSTKRYMFLQHELFHVGQWAEGGWGFGADVVFEGLASCNNKYEEADPWIPVGSVYASCSWAP